MREFDQYSEINDDGVRESQPYMDVQSTEFVNGREFSEETYHDDQTDIKEARPLSRRRLRQQGEETAAGAGAASSVAALSATFVALIVVASCIVPAVTDAGTDVDFVYVVSGSSEVDFEVFIGDFNGDALAIVLMQGTSEVYHLDVPGNGRYADAIKGLAPSTDYVLEVRSGIPAFHLIDSFEISTIEGVPAVPEATLQYATPGITTIRYAVTLNDYTADTDMTVELTEKGTVVHTETASALAISGLIAGLTPSTKYVLTVIDGDNNSINSWEVLTRDLPTAYYDKILYGTSYISYAVTIDGYQAGDEVSFIVKDPDGNIVDSYTAVSASDTHSVRNLSPGTKYTLYAECVGATISDVKTVTTQTA